MGPTEEAASRISREWKPHRIQTERHIYSLYSLFPTFCCLLPVAASEAHLHRSFNPQTLRGIIFTKSPYHCHLFYNTTSLAILLFIHIFCVFIFAFVSVLRVLEFIGYRSILGFDLGFIFAKRVLVLNCLEW